jgi:hypothetical protein
MERGRAPPAVWHGIREPLPPMQICKTKPSEARMSFRINNKFRKQAKNEPN